MDRRFGKMQTKSKNVNSGMPSALLKTKKENPK